MVTDKIKLDRFRLPTCKCWEETMVVGKTDELTFCLRIPGDKLLNKLGW